MPRSSNTPSDTNHYLPRTYSGLPHHSFNDNVIPMDQGHSDTAQMPLPSLKRNNTYPDGHQPLSGYQHMARSLPQYCGSPVATSPEDYQPASKDPRASPRIGRAKVKRPIPCKRCRSRHEKCVFEKPDSRSCYNCSTRNIACSGRRLTDENIEKKRRKGGTTVTDEQSRSNSMPEAAPSPESIAPFDGGMPGISTPTNTTYAPSGEPKSTTNTLSATSISNSFSHNLQGFSYEPSAYPPPLNNYDSLDGMHYRDSDRLFVPVGSNPTYALPYETTDTISAMGISGTSSHNSQRLTYEPSTYPPTVNSYCTPDGTLYLYNGGLSGTTNYGITRYNNA